MDYYTAFEYIKLDIANQFGLDKENFEPRLEWVDQNIDNLESFMDQADEPILFAKAVMALRDAQNGVASGHLVGFDACSSGLQIMGSLINCEVTARNTGLIDPTFRADMYSICTDTMNRLLAEEGIQVNVLRKQIKIAQMTHFYNSKAKPKEIFGEGTIELEKFYEAQEIVAPGACKVMGILQSLWNRDVRGHEWILPDGFHARVKVMYDFEKSIEVDELQHSSFTHKFSENLSTNEFQAITGEYERDGISLPANIVHSIDGMVVREMGRRCNYNKKQLEQAQSKIRSHLQGKAFCVKPDTCKFISLVHAENPHKAIAELSTDDLQRLDWLISEVLTYRSFEMLAVHDE